MLIRELNENDYLEYKRIRLELLKSEPTSFGSSFEDESAFIDSFWKQRLSKDTVATIGVFEETELIGICVIVFSPRTKMRHIASIHSMYVKNEYRGKGYAKEMLLYAEKIAKASKVERLNLSVVDSNTAAAKLYKKLGYVETGKELDTIKYEDKYYSLLLMSKKLKA